MLGILFMQRFTGVLFHLSFIGNNQGLENRPCSSQNGVTYTPDKGWFYTLFQRGDRGKNHTLSRVAASYPDVSLSLWKCAREGRREGDNGRDFACCLYPSHGPLRFITSRSPAPLRKTKRLRRRLVDWYLLAGPCSLYTADSIIKGYFGHSGLGN